MSAQKQLSVRAKKNWKWTLFLFFVGIWLVSISTVIFFDAEKTFSSTLLLVAMFLAGLICILTLPYVISLEEKDLIFSFSTRILKMSNPQDKEDKDYNKSVFSSSMKKFYHKKGVHWIFIGTRRLSEFVNGLFYMDAQGKEHLFLDLTLPEVTLNSVQIQEIVRFVEDGIGFKPPANKLKKPLS